jgi:hypothetical protein
MPGLFVRKSRAMGLTILTNPRPFTFDAFVDELRELVDQTSTFVKDRITHDDPSFRRWKLAVDDALVRVHRLGYEDINTQALGRNFRSNRASATFTQNEAAFVRDLSDTIAEFDQIIANFDRYGAPGLGTDDLNARLEEAWVNHDVVSRQLQETREELTRVKEQLALVRQPVEVQETQIVEVHTVAPAVLAAPTTISLPVPEKEKVTFRWLIENVSYPVWVVLGTLLIGAVGVGRLFH